METPTSSEAEGASWPENVPRKTFVEAAKEAPSRPGIRPRVRFAEGPEHGAGDPGCSDAKKHPACVWEKRFFLVEEAEPRQCPSEDDFKSGYPYFFAVNVTELRPGSVGLVPVDVGSIQLPGDPKHGLTNAFMGLFAKSGSLKGARVSVTVHGFVNRNPEIKKKVIKGFWVNALEA